jgi:hypothetical protein
MPKAAHFIAFEVVSGGRAVFLSPNVKSSVIEVSLIPRQIDHLTDAKAVPEDDLDQKGIAESVASRFLRRFA